MINTILGSKGKMGQTFVEDTRVPVTLVKAGPCVVTQIKNRNNDGYWAVQLGFDTKKIKNVTKPLQGHLKGVISKLKSSDNDKKKAPRFLREVKLEEEPSLKVGDLVKVSDIFKLGDVVAVTGTSKGKGFAGAIKRWGFAKQGRTHGQSDRLRAPGSIGAMGVGRVWKGKKMAGRMGNQRVTIKNLIVVDIDSENGTLSLSGPVPGIPGGLLMIEKLASGKLEELVQEVSQQQVVEGEPEAEDGESGDVSESKAESKE
jgi:large subunit ribosomal protein L3